MKYLKEINLSLNREEFVLNFRGVRNAFNAKLHNKLPTEHLLLTSIYGKGDYLCLSEIYSRGMSLKGHIVHSLVNRIICTTIISRSAKMLDKGMESFFDRKKIWPFIYDSVMDLGEEEIVALVGSQGFLSIPIFRSESVENNFEFVRLHIWDKSLVKYVDENKWNAFSMHSHLFFARSWILNGGLVDTQFEIQESQQESQEEAQLGLFKIKWESSVRDKNRMTSKAVNLKRPIIIQETNINHHNSGGTYIIPAGKFHKSRVNQNAEIVATLFLFSSQYGRVADSYVIGPADIKESEIKRKAEIQPKYLLEKLDRLMK